MTSPGCIRARTAACRPSIPKSGYFGVVPGTNAKTNRNAYEMIRHDTIFTNVAADRRQSALVGRPDGRQAGHRLAGPPLRSRQRPGRPSELALHGVGQAESQLFARLADAPGGVPISAIVFGGRRADVAPLVYQARDWLHGVLVGAGVASETTAAATDAVGVVRRDPMAMKPFAGYNFGDYWAHWINVGAKLKTAAEDLPRQLVPPGQRRQVPVAGLRRELEGAALDHRSLQRQRRGARHGHRTFARNPSDLDLTGLTSDPAALDELLMVRSETLAGGVRGHRNSIWPNSANACRSR